MVKNPPANAGDARDADQSLGQEDPWKKKWQPTPIFLPGKSHGRGSLTGYSPWGHKSVGLILGTDGAATRDTKQL